MQALIDFIYVAINILCIAIALGVALGIGVIVYVLLEKARIRKELKNK